MRMSDVIDDWKGAYEAANGKPPPEIYYRGGWFMIHYDNMAVRHRRAGLEAMTERLRAAAEQRSKEQK